MMISCRFRRTVPTLNSMTSYGSIIINDPRITRAMFVQQRHQQRRCFQWINTQSSRLYRDPLNHSVAAITTTVRASQGMQAIVRRCPSLTRRTTSIMANRTYIATRKSSQQNEQQKQHEHQHQQKQQSSQYQSIWKRIWDELTQRPIEYATIPIVAGFVGISTNWLGVKMLFYPIEYVGYDVFPKNSTILPERPKYSPYGYFGWQGVVPTKTELMARRLVNIITQRLLRLTEVFQRLDTHHTSQLLSPIILQVIREDCGYYWYTILQPILPRIVTYVLQQLQNEIDTVLDLDELVLHAFVRDKIVLVDLFQKVGRVELKFLVESGFGFGILLGIIQMLGWVVSPHAYTLPIAGALVGYITNWIAIKLLFEPADPIPIGPFTLQGLFESRQVEVSDEFGNFLNQRVLQSYSILHGIVKDGDDGEFYKFLRQHLPYPIPSHILSAVVKAIQQAADYPELYPELHSYITKQLDISDTLASRLKELPPKEFEDLLHPVFQEDEIILIATGGVLGFAAGLVQTRLGWGGPYAIRNSILLIISALLASAMFFVYNDGPPADIIQQTRNYEPVPIDEEDIVDVVLVPPMLLRRNTVLRKRE